MDFRGLDYNKIKEEYRGKTLNELEDIVYLCAIKASKAQNEGRLLDAVEYMARIALVHEVCSEMELN